MKRRSGILLLVSALATGGGVAAYEWWAESNPEKRQVAPIIAALKLTPDAHIADIGAGDGLFTLPLARQASVVYAVEIEQDKLQKIARPAQAQGLSNVHPVLAAADDPRLPEPVAWLLFVYSLQHINNRAAYLQNLRRYLKPGGRLAVIDPLDDWPLFHGQMKYTTAELDEWLQAAGLQRVVQYDFVRQAFFVVYQMAEP